MVEVPRLHAVPNPDEGKGVVPVTQTEGQQRTGSSITQRGPEGQWGYGKVNPLNWWCKEPITQHEERRRNPHNSTSDLGEYRATWFQAGTIGVVGGLIVSSFIPDERPSDPPELPLVGVTAEGEAVPSDAILLAPDSPVAYSDHKLVRTEGRDDDDVNVTINSHDASTPGTDVLLIAPVLPESKHASFSLPAGSASIVAIDFGDGDGKSEPGECTLYIENNPDTSSDIPYKVAASPDCDPNRAIG